MTSHWLARTSKNVIKGPLTKAQVLSMIREGELGPQDEVCHNEAYWIYLHEEQEVWTQLGIRVPRSTCDDEEVTEATDTHTETLPDLLEPAVAEEFDPDQTAILSSRPSRKSKQTAGDSAEIEESFQIYQKPQKLEIRPAGFTPSPATAPAANLQNKFIGRVEILGGEIKKPTSMGVAVIVFTLMGATALFFLLRSLQAW